MVKLVVDGRIKTEMPDENNDLVTSCNDVRFEISKKDEGAVDDVFTSIGIVDIKTNSDGQDITISMNISDLMKCLKFLENWYGKVYENNR